MNQNIADYFARLSPLSEIERAAIAESAVVKEYEKGTVLLREGQLALNTFFVFKGLVRQYRMLDGEEKTTAFFTEEQWVISLSSVEETPSPHFWVCDEPCVLLVGDDQSAQTLFNHYPRLESIARKVLENAFAEYQQTVNNYLTDTPEQRYLRLSETHSAGATIPSGEFCRRTTRIAKPDSQTNGVEETTRPVSAVRVVSGQFVVYFRNSLQKNSEPSMQNELLSFVSQFDTLTSDEAAAIADLMTMRSFKKGDVLVREGDVVTRCYFVLKGCLRQYRLVDGVEKTTQFYTEEQSAVLFTSLASQTQSDSYLTCAEDTLLIVGEPNQETEMYGRFPKLAAITRAIMEQDFGKTQDTLSNFVTSSPEERYLHLLQTRPDLLQRVPQHQLASYIGITPESLSRIRKRIMKAHERA